FLETGTVATLAAASAGIERKRARGQALCLRFRQGRKKLAHAIIKPEIQYRGRSWRARQRRLIHHDDFVESMCASHCPACTRLMFAGLAFRSQKISIQHFLN